MWAEKNEALGSPLGHRYDLSLLDLEAQLSKKRKGNKFIILHIMGSHAAYNNRVPDDSFRPFRPICDKASLYNCTNEEQIYVSAAFKPAFSH